jgi:hypothetical protein
MMCNSKMAFALAKTRKIWIKATTYADYSFSLARNRKLGIKLIAAIPARNKSLCTLLAELPVWDAILDGELGLNAQPKPRAQRGSAKRAQRPARCA